MRLKVCNTGWLMLTMLVIGGCADSVGPQGQVDQESRRQALLQADAEFSEMAFNQGLDVAYERFLAPNAVQLPDGGQPLAGKQEIMANVVALVADNQFSLSWEAADAIVSVAGDMGFTWGNYYLEGLDLDGEPYVADGKYANFWSYSEAEGWQVLLDTSNQNEPPFADELALELDFLSDEMIDENQAELPE